MRATNFALLNRVLRAEPGEAREVAIIGAQDGAMLNSKRCQKSVHDQGPTHSGFWKQLAEDRPMLFGRADYCYIGPRKPTGNNIDRLIELVGFGRNLRMRVIRKKARIVSQEKPTMPDREKTCSSHATARS